MSDGPPTPATPVDIQDPLPESSWLWRRVFTFVVTGVVLWFLWGAIDRLGDVAMITPHLGVPALLSLCKWIIALTILMTTYYLIAPSAEQVVKMFKIASMFRNGVQVAGRQVIDGDRSETVTTVGRPVPPAPGRGAPNRGQGRHEDPEHDDGPPWAGHKENI